MTKMTPAEAVTRATKLASTPSKPGDALPCLLSLAETADRLGCSPKTLQRRIRAGDLPVIRDGRLVRVHPQDLARYVAARRSL